VRKAITADTMRDRAVRGERRFRSILPAPVLLDAGVVLGVRATSITADVRGVMVRFARPMMG